MKRKSLDNGTRRLKSHSLMIPNKTTAGAGLTIQPGEEPISLSVPCRQEIDRNHGSKINPERVSDEHLRAVARSRKMDHYKKVIGQLSSANIITPRQLTSEHMGILYERQDDDAALIVRICEIAASDWNTKFSNEFGVFVLIKPEAAEAISLAGGNMLLRSFPKDPRTPSAFKRVATLLVMMCLHPFIVVRQRDENGEFKIPVVVAENLRDFAVQFIIDTLPLIFSVLMKQDDEGNWQPLDKWVGLPSEGFNDEFLLFLKWLGNSDCVVHSLGNPVYNDERLTRIILGTSLILEAAYSYSASLFAGEDIKLLVGKT